MSRVVAVVCTYWAERRKHIPRILADLRAGSVVPDRTLVLNNHPEACAFDGADIVHTGANFSTRGKYVTALLEPADYYLLLDDDCTVRRKTLECLLKHARRGLVVGYWGIQLNHPTGPQRLIMPDQIAVETPVDVFHGRAMFMAYDAVVRMFAVEEWTHAGAGDGWGRYQGDDLIAGLANPGAIMVPMRGEEQFEPLSEEGVALHHMPGFGGERERFIAAVLEAVATRGRPAW